MPRQRRGGGAQRAACLLSLLVSRALSAPRTRAHWRAHAAGRVLHVSQHQSQGGAVAAPCGQVRQCSGARSQERGAAGVADPTRARAGGAGRRRTAPAASPAGNARTSGGPRRPAAVRVNRCLERYDMVVPVPGHPRPDTFRRACAHRMQERATWWWTSRKARPRTTCW